MFPDGPKLRALLRGPSFGVETSTGLVWSSVAAGERPAGPVLLRVLP